MYCFDLKLELRENSEKIVSGKWSSIANADDVVTGWKVAKDQLCRVLMPTHGKILCLVWKTNSGIKKALFNRRKF